MAGLTRESRMSTREIDLIVYVERLIAHESQLRQTELTARDHALNIQAAEYERRLDMLNHAHARAMEERTHTVSRELFEEFRRGDFAILRKAVDDHLAERRGVAGGWGYAVGVIGFVLGILAVAHALQQVTLR